MGPTDGRDDEDEGVGTGESPDVEHEVAEDAAPTDEPPGPVGEAPVTGGSPGTESSRPGSPEVPADLEDPADLEEAPAADTPPPAAGTAVVDGTDAETTATDAVDAPTAAVAPTPSEDTAASGVDAATTRVSPVDAPTAAVSPVDAPTAAVPPVAAAPTDGAPHTTPTATPDHDEPASSRASSRPLRVALIAAVALLAVLGVWIVSGTVGSSGPGGTATPTEAAAPASRVTTNPATGATDVSPAAGATVAVADGRLTDVALMGPDGKAVPGRATPDGWASTGELAYGATYTWKGIAVDAEDRATPVTGTFATVDPAEQTSATLNIADGDTVGVGAPIIVQFDGTVADKAAAERSLQVRTSVPTEGSWAWLPDTEQGSRAHWRPKEYWRSGTKVEVVAGIHGTDLGDGAWGGDTVTTHFTIGRSQIVKADVNSFQMVVVRDGQTVMTVPASYGLGSDPNRNTTNGTHVVMSKAPVYYMTNEQYGYENLRQEWAVRISNNGEFIHANPSSADAQGNENVTHGCVNLSTADAQAYFDTAIYGDPVEVTGSPVPMPRTDIYDWSLSWEEWTSMSALDT